MTPVRRTTTDRRHTKPTRRRTPLSILKQHVSARGDLPFRERPPRPPHRQRDLAPRPLRRSAGGRARYPLRSARKRALRRVAWRGRGGEPAVGTTRRVARLSHRVVVPQPPPDGADVECMAARLHRGHWAVFVRTDRRPGAAPAPRSTSPRRTTSRFDGSFFCRRPTHGDTLRGPTCAAIVVDRGAVEAFPSWTHSQTRCQRLSEQLPRDCESIRSFDVISSGSRLRKPVRRLLLRDPVRPSRPPLRSLDDDVRSAATVDRLSITVANCRSTRPPDAVHRSRP